MCGPPLFTVPLRCCSCVWFVVALKLKSDSISPRIEDASMEKLPSPGNIKFTSPFLLFTSMFASGVFGVIWT